MGDTHRVVREPQADNRLSSVSTWSSEEPEFVTTMMYSLVPTQPFGSVRALGLAANGAPMQCTPLIGRGAQ